MNRKIFEKISIAWCAAVMMLLSISLWICLPVWASDTQGQRTGSLELHLPAEKTGQEITLYTVADYVDGSYIFTEDFAESGVAITNLNDSAQVQEAAGRLADYAAGQKLSGISKTPDENGNVDFYELQPALYLTVQTAGNEFLTVQEALIPIPCLDENQEFIYDVVISPKYSFPGGAVIVTKVDEEGDTVGQARFVLQQKEYSAAGMEIPEGAETGNDEYGEYYWKELQADLVTSENGQIVVMDIPQGIYRFVETEAPEGYILDASPVSFEIIQEGKVVEVSGIYRTESGNPVQVQAVNRQTSVKINKVDIDGNPVAGARLVIRSVDGEALFTFVSTLEPYEIKRLPAGDYLLSEVDPPEGYRISEDVPFTVEDGEDSINEVTMVDEKEETTSGRLTVTKTLTDIDGQFLAAEDASFYTALFADEELTERVSGVKELHYQGTTRETVIFENLVMDQKYYISETNEFGEPVYGIEHENGVYAAEYPESAEIAPTPEDPDQEFAFTNRFLEIPDGYYYTGKLTITKKVLKGNADYPTDAVFYAALFTDPEYTQQYEDVVALEMNGKSESSVTIYVNVGEDPNGSQTYYVAETDENGNVLTGSDGLEFTVSVDRTEVVVTTAQAGEEVTITNTFYEDVTPTPTPGSGQPTGTPAPGDNTPGTPSTRVQTGDDTPTESFILILISALVVIAGILFYQRQK